MFDALVKKQQAIAVIGLGYVGLPIALEFARKFRVIGFDINAQRVAMMQQHIDPSGELDAADFEGADILFTHHLEDLKQATFYIVAVPTPIDAHTMPDLKPLLGASETVGKVLKKGDVVVYESTVYPGCTEEDCLPVLEQFSGLKFPADFTLGYSPERINPGDKEHTLTKIKKVVSGSDAATLELVSQVYGSIITAGIHKASSIKVAEAAKIIENTQRDLNIALMNELSMIFDRMKINTYEVLEAAGTKWNFLKFTPGLVGGHCIGVDPYYLTYKSKALGHEPKVILSGRTINDGMGAHIAKRTVQKLVKMGKDLNEAKVLVLGATFKENVGDIRNSKVADVVHELEAFSLRVDITDPEASSKEMEHEYGIKLISLDQIATDYDAIILAVPHRDYLLLDADWYQQHTNNQALIVDIKGVIRGLNLQRTYWSL